MDNQPGKNKISLRCDRLFSCDHSNLICSLLFNLIRFEGKFLRMFISGEWKPVRMGWYTSCYCSCRSCIG